MVVWLLRIPLSLPLLKWVSKEADGDEAMLVALKLLRLLTLLCLAFVSIAGSYIPLSFTSKSCPWTSTIAEASAVVRSIFADIVVFAVVLRNIHIPSLDGSRWTRHPSCLHIASTFCRCFLDVLEAIRGS